MNDTGRLQEAIDELLAELGDYTAKERKFGRVNHYTCDTCGGVIVTVDVDEGVTPFLLGWCRATLNCTGEMKSAFYRVVDREARRAEWEWYRPKVADTTPTNFDHVRKSGLLLRPRKPT